MNKPIKFFFNVCVLIVITGVFLFGMGYEKYLPTINSDDSSTTSITKIPIVSNASSQQIFIPKSIDWSKIHIDKVEVYKAQRRMDLISEGKVIQSYPIRLGFTPQGHKTTEGDGKTPEGKYKLDWRNPKSKFYKSLHISYPNKADIAQAKVRGVSAGSNIMIHGTAKKTGGSKGQPFYEYLPKGDWTLGCVSVSNKNMDIVWNNVKDGTEIEIFP